MNRAVSIALLGNVLLVLVWLPGRPIGAEPEKPPEAEKALISLNFPENLELKVLIDYVSQRLTINILYDEQVGNKRVTLRSPAQVPQSSLLGLLESVLKMKGLALVDEEQKGWKRVAVTTNLLAISKSAKELGEAPRSTVAVTEIIALKHAETEKVEQLLRPFLTQPGGNIVRIPEQKMLIITDFAPNLERMSELIRLMDQPAEEVVTEFVVLKHLEAADAAQQVKELLGAKLKFRVSAAPAPAGIEINYDGRTNQLVLTGPKGLVREAVGIVETLDVPLALETRMYSFESTSPDRVDRLLKEMLDPLASKRLYHSAVDKEGNMLVVTASPEIHQKVESLKGELDKPITEERSPIRFYKLANATAMDVLQTISAIEGGEEMSQVSLDIQVRADAQHQDQRSRLQGPNQPPSAPGQVVPIPPMLREREEGATREREGESRIERGQTAPTTETRQYQSPTALPSRSLRDPLTGLGQAPTRPAGPRSVRTKSATVTADPNTNSIIVVADPATQKIYENLIKMLDRRRPQVLIETTIVTLDTSNNFSLGVEVAKSGGGDNQYLVFSSFGLSNVNAQNAALSLIPGLGFNGAILSSDVANLVLRTLLIHGRSKVVAAPKILVNDNATGTLSSINEAPFTSVNASDTVATTSFAGFVSAGTTITVTPHISEGEHLQLEYSVALNSFSGESTDGIPPPRQTNSVDSQVTIPDGHTIVVGGLNRTDFSQTINTIPFLEKIPGIKHLFSNRTENDTASTLFIFIKPVILRSDTFEDLKFLSERDLQTARLPGSYPASEPLSLQ